MTEFFVLADFGSYPHSVMHVSVTSSIPRAKDSGNTGGFPTLQ